jgi:hypothetical protein
MHETLKFENKFVMWLKWKKESSEMFADPDYPIGSDVTYHKNLDPELYYRSNSGDRMRADARAITSSSSN